jgi:C-terminal processing protease CtpA/Prc
MHPKLSLPTNHMIHCGHSCSCLWYALDRRVGLLTSVAGADTNHRGESYEGVGLVPDIAVGEAYPSDAELREGRDDALAAAVGLLSEGAGASRL